MEKDSQEHLWPADSRTHLPLSLVHPRPTDVNSSPCTRTSFSHPFQEARSPQAGAPPPPLSSRLTDLLCAGDELGVGRETWGRGSQPHLQRSPELGPPTGTRSRHRAGKRRQWGLVGGRGPGGR